MPSTRREFLSHLSGQALVLGGIVCLGSVAPGAIAPAQADTGGDTGQLPLGDTPQGSFLYNILREGAAIGTQRQDFRSLSADGLAVLTKVDIDVRILGLSLFRFTQEIEEIWQDRKLTAFRSHTNDDGEERQVELKRQGERLVGSYNGKPRDLPGDLIPSTLWHPDSVRQTVVLDTIKGRERKVSVKDLGWGEAALSSGREKAHHFVFSGELNRELWYGLAGAILVAEMVAKDGSLIRQELHAAN